jgi:hypothetical protein
MKISLREIPQGRKRFLKTKNLEDINNWPSHLAEIKNILSLHSNFQIVGNQVYFEVVSRDSTPQMLLEVIGAPIPLEQYALSLIDTAVCTSLVYQFSDINLFNTDFESLLETSWNLYEEILRGVTEKPGSKLLEFFHIVLNDDKIELHFFRQKDYIQK